MKKKIIVLLFVLCGAGTLFAQNVLPGYRGYWENPKLINIIDLIEFYPDQLPYLRNEIYARYGRPFTTRIYQDYFRAKSWYRERSDFSESWLSQTDRANAEFIASVEQVTRSYVETENLLIRNIEYTGGGAVLTITSRRELVWTDQRVSFGAYGLNGYGRNTESYFTMGDWILIYSENWYWGGYDMIAYKLDHSSRRILDYVADNLVSLDGLDRLLRSQGRTLHIY